jgi:hypothetical protein
MSRTQDLLAQVELNNYFEELSEEVASIEDESERAIIEDVINQILATEDTTMCEKITAIEEVTRIKWKKKITPRAGEGTRKKIEFARRRPTQNKYSAISGH